MLCIATADERPPAHLLLGSDALELDTGKLEALNALFREWEPTTRSTDAPPGVVNV